MAGIRRSWQTLRVITDAVFQEASFYRPETFSGHFRAARFRLFPRLPEGQTQAVCVAVGFFHHWHVAAYPVTVSLQSFGFVHRAAEAELPLSSPSDIHAASDGEALTVQTY